MPRLPLTDDELETMRARLGAAALAIYRDEGLDALSFRRLADVMGLSHTLPYRYFENKEALLARMRTDCTDLFAAFVRVRERKATAPLAKVRAVIEAYVAFVRRYPAEYLLIFSMHQPPPTLYPELLAARRSLFEHAVDVMQECVRSGDVSGDARELAHASWITLHGLMTLHVANQLVHGLTLEQLVQPVMERLLALPMTVKASTVTARIARARLPSRRTAARKKNIPSTVS